MNGVTKGSQSLKRDNSEPDPPLTNGDDSPSTIITPEAEFDTEQSQTYNQEYLKELTATAVDSNSMRGEKQHCTPEQVPLIQKTRSR
ncbi:unnamed protein product [Hymenolepis diminuta]|uniref:CTNNB1_binding domain-containing protein n=1 Tax=Hymenolepis diminuta TaxID=6216 RepID=A0A0R3STG0_HYMDI|nr:unnamed protein product [Hymenolepis diminuta]VUZ43566.1 unnamed protein product [Hymenolepis diminuta]